MDNPRVKFYTEKSGFWAHGTAVLLGLATVFQIIGCWGLWTDRFFALTQILLPVASFFLFVLLLSLLGNKALWLTFIPFLGGVAFYGVQAWYMDSRIAMMIGIVYCVLSAVLYLGTVFALIRTKWLLVPLFGLLFLYRAFYRDVMLLQNVEEPVGFAAGMREMSLLCVLLGMTLLALGMKKRVKERKSKETVPEQSDNGPVPASAPSPAAASSSEQAPSPETPESVETDIPSESESV